MAQASKVAKEVFVAAILTGLTVGALDAVNTTGSTLLTLLVPIGKAITIVVAVMYGVNQM